MNENNLYRAPEATLKTQYDKQQDALPDQAVRYILKSGFWARIASIFFIFITGFMAVSILLAALFPLFSSKADTSNTSAFLMAVFFILLIGAIPVVLTYFFYHYLKRYADNAKKLKDDPSIEHLTTCTNSLSSFIKLNSILLILSFIIGILVIIMAISALGR